MADYRLIHGDALEVLRGMADNSVDAIVADPPAGINFMGAKFDHDRGGRTQWVAWLAEIMRESLRVIKPGGHALVWALPKKSHWTSLALEDAGWEIREKKYHLFGSGFPKSLNVSRELLALPWCACDVVTGAGTPSTGVMDERLAAGGAGLDLGVSVPLAGGVLRGGAIAGAGAERVVRVPEGLTAAGASLGVLGDSFGARPDKVDMATPFPSQDVSTSQRATDPLSTLDGSLANGAGMSSGGLEAGDSAGHRRSAVKRGVKERVGEFNPVMLRPLDVTVVATGDEVSINVGSFQVQPEALGNEMMGDHAVSTTAVMTRFVPVDNGGADVLPSATFVRPLPTAPSGVALTGDTSFVVNGHTSAGAVEGDGIASSDSPFELGATDDASEGLRATFELGASSPLECDGLVGSGTGPGTVLNFTATIGEDNATLWTGFGKHGSIIRQLVSECKVSVCPNCRQPQRPEWIVDGLGSALKPAVEEWILVRKPLSEPSIAANVLRHGVGGLNIDACRVGTSKDGDPNRFAGVPKFKGTTYADDAYSLQMKSGAIDNNQGRFPSHLLLSHHPSCIRRGEKRVKGGNGVRGTYKQNETMRGYKDGSMDKWETGQTVGYADADGRELVADYDCHAGCPTGQIGEAARFFAVFEPDPDALFVYAPKASRSDREAGLEGMEGTRRDVVIHNGVCVNCGKVWIDGKRQGPCCDNPKRGSRASSPNKEAGSGVSVRNTHPT